MSSERDSTGRFAPQYKYNKNYFKELNSENCYWAGFLAADGSLNVRPGEYNVQLGLSLKDIEHIEKFACAIESNNPIKTGKTGYKETDYARISLYSAEQWHHDLDHHFNITTKKSLTLKRPNISDVYLQLCFLRGYIDGDGSIYKSSIRDKEYLWLSFMSTLDICEWGKELIETHVSENARKSYQIYPRKSNYMYQIYGKRAEEVVRKLKLLDTPCLERKWSI